MSQSDIYSKIRWMLMSNFRLKDTTNHFNANLFTDLGLDHWDITQLMFLIENQFDIRFKSGIEENVETLEQIALLTHKALQLSSTENLA